MKIHRWSGPLLAGALVSSACATQEGEPFLAGATSGDSAAAIPPDRVLALTPLASSDAIASALGARFGVVDGIALSAAEAARVTPQARALLLDLSRTSVTELEAMRGVFDAAAQARVPVVLEHTDIAGMTAAVGFGLRASAVVAEPATIGVGYRLRVLGDSGDADVAAGAVEHAELAHGGITPPDVAAAQVPATAARRAEPRAASHTPDDVVRYVEEAGLRASTVALNPTTLVPGTYAHYYLEFTPYSWSPGDGQSATMDYDFEVELYAASEPARKFMIVRPAGSGVNPGGPGWDTLLHRGWFQEKLAVEITPLTGALSSYTHQPTSDNRSSSFTVTNGISVTSEVATTGPTVGISFNLDQSATQNLSDFGVVDQSIGNVSKWSFEMTSAEGNPYQDWDDLVSIWTSFLFNPPSLARSTLFPRFETVYAAPIDYRGRPTVHFQYTQTLRDTWVDWYVVYSATHSRAYNMTRWWDYAVDFGRVHAPNQGTVPFVERFGTASYQSDWQIVDEGTTGTAAWTLVDSNWVQHTGGATNPDGTRGTWLWAPRTYLGQGSLSGRVRANDVDTWGFMYSIQDQGNYYRAEVNHAQGIARIVKVRNGVMSELARAAVSPRFGDWQDWRIERSGLAHHLYLSGVRIVTGFDSELASGSVALYASGMSSVLFGAPLQIEYPGVWPSALNLALGRAASQSSVAFDGAPGRAVDGDVYASYTGGSVTHTNLDPGAWWKVDLGAVSAIEAVTLWNRTDCCTDRLSNFYVELLDANGAVVKSTYYAGIAPASVTLSMDNRAGRFVRVRLVGTNYLSLAEVQVWPTPL